MKLNSTKILFLKMLRKDIIKDKAEALALNQGQLENNVGLLTGQTISRSSIENLSSFRLMNPDERKTVDLILSELKPKEVGSEKGRVLLKHIDSLVPSSYLSDGIDFKDVV